MEKIWDYIYKNELKSSQKENNVMLIESPMNQRENSEKITQIIFKNPGLYIAIAGVLSLKFQFLFQYSFIK